MKGVQDDGDCSIVIISKSANFGQFWICRTAALSTTFRYQQVECLKANNDCDALLARP